MANAEIEMFLILFIKVSLFWVAYKRGVKIVFDFDIQQISFSDYSNDNIFYANNRCNDILFDYIILFKEF